MKMKRTRVRGRGRELECESEAKRIKSQHSKYIYATIFTLAMKEMWDDDRRIPLHVVHFNEVLYSRISSSFSGSLRSIFFHTYTFHFECVCLCIRFRWNFSCNSNTYSMRHSSCFLFHWRKFPEILSALETLRFRRTIPFCFFIHLFNVKKPQINFWEIGNNDAATNDFYTLKINDLCSD